MVVVQRKFWNPAIATYSALEIRGAVTRLRPDDRMDQTRQGAFRLTETTRSESAREAAVASWRARPEKRDAIDGERRTVDSATICYTADGRGPRTPASTISRETLMGIHVLVVEDSPPT